jgi:peptide/nickel transport system substrate-binding protein
MVRRFAPLSFLAMMACTGGTAVTAPADGDAERRDTLVVAWGSDVGSLLSVVASTVNDTTIIEALNMPTIATDFDCSIKKLPGVATEWSWSEDGKTLAMTLRDGLTFSDGHPVTSEDLAFTYELIADPLVSTPRAGFVERMTPEGRPRIIDATHVEWLYTQAYDRDAQMAEVAIEILPKHLLMGADRATLKGHPFNKAPIGHGPWMIAKYEPNERLVLEPNPNFTGPEEMRPRLNRIVFKIIPEYATRLLELQNGEVDFMEAITVADADMLRRNNDNINVVRRGWRSTDYLGWNLTNPMFADVRVRKALAMSVNIDDMIAKLLTSSENGEVYARRAVGTVTPELCGVHNDDIVPVPFDLAGAKALFAEVGWTDSNGDGVLDKDGKDFEFTLITNNGNKRRADAAIRLQSAFKDAGVKMNIEKLEFNAMIERLHGREYQAVLGGWAAALFVDPASMWHSDRPDRKYEFNYGSYSNPRADELIELGLATPEPEKAAPIWKELQQVIYDDQPYLFLWWMDELEGLDKRFETYQIDVLSNLHDLHDWEVPPDKVKYQ